MIATPEPGSTATLHAIEAMAVLSEQARIAGHMPGETAWEQFWTGMQILANGCTRCHRSWIVSREQEGPRISGEHVLESCTVGAS